MNKTTLFESRGRDAARKVGALMDELDKITLRVYKRKIPDSMLFISSWGDVKSPTIGLTAYYEPGQRDLVQFLQDTIDNLS